ncbi:MAG: hypothetical protein ACPGXK_05030 [Phycisphaerae bacterium]
MNTAAGGSNGIPERTWVDVIGIPLLVRALFIQLPTWGLATLGVIASVIWGTCLGVIWSSGGETIGAAAINDFAVSHITGLPYDVPEGDLNPFTVWRDHQATALRTLLQVPGIPTSATAGLSRMEAAQSFLYGLWWLPYAYPVFGCFFLGGSLLIWSFVGGAICRLVGTRLTRDEKITAADAITFVKPRYLGGFVAAPCIPLIMFVILAVLLFLFGGLVLWIPLIGDVLFGVLALFFALGGVVLVVLLTGLVVAGVLFWPSIAVDGADAFDAFACSMSYIFRRPWKTIVYGLVALLLTSVAWGIVRWTAYAGLFMMRTVVGFGSSPGLWGASEPSANKLERIWVFAGPDNLHTWPAFADLAWNETISASLVGVAVSLVIALVWGFLASLFYSYSTAAYLLLRFDVDRTDIGDIYDDHYEPLDEPAPDPVSDGKPDERASDAPSGS